MHRAPVDGSLEPTVRREEIEMIHAPRTRRPAAVRCALLLLLVGSSASAQEPIGPFTDGSDRFAFPGQTQSPEGVGATGIFVPEMAACDALVMDFLTTYDIPGATFALARDGKLVYLRAFGTADLAGTEPTQPYHRFRIASVSKPITSVAIMTLLENGLLSLEDPVFGDGGLLENHPYLSQANVTDPLIYEIRVRNLLDHSVGWDRSIDCFPDPTTPYPWWISGCDPGSAPLHVTEVLGEPNPMTGEARIRFLLEKGLDFYPGTGYAYSNVGYGILGEIIEELTGMAYDEYVKTNVLAPLGICDMQLGNNLLHAKQEREGEYVGNGATTLSCYGTGEYVPVQYGGFNLEAIDSSGRWISSARELTRLLVAVDGFPSKPDILTLPTIITMTTSSGNNLSYALGWTVDPVGGLSNDWWHKGSLTGSRSFFARTADAYTWAILLNKSVSGGNFWSDLHELPWDCIAATAAYPTHDLMALPTENASGIVFSDPTEDSVTVSWTPGHGDGRMLVGSANDPVSAFPRDGRDFIGSPAWGIGFDLGGGNFVLSAGSSNSVTVTGLSPQTPYHFRLFEFTKNVETGNYPLYLLCNSETGSITLSTVPGEVEDSLRLTKSATEAGDLTLTWNSSCEAGADDYGIYEGTLGLWSSHTALDCSDDGEGLAETITPGPGDRYYLLVPHNADGEGSYGRTSSGAERSTGSPTTCRPVQVLSSCR